MILLFRFCILLIISCYIIKYISGFESRPDRKSLSIFWEVFLCLKFPKLAWGNFGYKKTTARKCWSFCAGFLFGPIAARQSIPANSVMVWGFCRAYPLGPLLEEQWIPSKLAWGNFGYKKNCIAHAMKLLRRFSLWADCRQAINPGKFSNGLRLL
jgi:hypothetical protein